MKKIVRLAVIVFLISLVGFPKFVKADEQNFTAEFDVEDFWDETKYEAVPSENDDHILIGQSSGMTFDFLTLKLEGTLPNQNTIIENVESTIDKICCLTPQISYGINEKGEKTYHQFQV